MTNPTRRDDELPTTVCVPREVLELYDFMKMSFVPFTSQHEQIDISLQKAKAAMDAIPAANPAQGGEVLLAAANLLQRYSDYIHDEVKADNLERHPYVPEIERSIEELRSLASSPAAPDAVAQETFTSYADGMIVELESTPPATPPPSPTLYDHRDAVDKAARNAGPRLYVALRNLLQAVNERRGFEGVASIESIVFADAESALLAATVNADAIAAPAVAREVDEEMIERAVSAFGSDCPNPNSVGYKLDRQKMRAALAAAIDLAKARDAFFDSLSGATLQGAPTGKYLRNRLELAFVSGYEAGEKSRPSPTPEGAKVEARHWKQAFCDHMHGIGSHASPTTLSASDWIEHRATALAAEDSNAS